MDKFIAVSNTDETGEIFYRVTGEKIFGIRIEQERGILKTAEVKGVTTDLKKIISFAKTLAKEKATAVMLYGLCDDFSDARKLP